jgi:hypothetical protein
MIYYLLVTADVLSSSPILVTFMMKAMFSYETSGLRKPHGVTSQKMAFFIMNDVFWRPVLRRYEREDSVDRAEVLQDGGFSKLRK